MTINANSGSPEDLNAAIAQAIATGDDEVVIPAGRFPFNGYGDESIVLFSPPPQGLTIRGAGIGVTILEMTEFPNGNTKFIEVRDILSNRTGAPVRISGISFIGKTQDEAISYPVAIRMMSVTDFVVEYCSFDNFPNYGVIMSNIYRNPGGRGLVHNCSFDNSYKDDPEYVGTEEKWGYGIGAVANTSLVPGEYDHDVDYYLGKYDGLDNILYVEDCTFRRCRHSIASNQGAWYVVRNCEFHDIRPPNYFHVDVHGQAGTNAVGGRGMECYNNRFVGYSTPHTDGTPRWYNGAVGLRGGGGVVYNNVYENMKYGVMLLWYDPGPAAAFPNDIWIWDNTPEMVIVQPGYEERIIQDQNFFVGSPRPGYTPYPYPHPLTTLPITPFSPWMIIAPLFVGLVLVKSLEK